MSVLCVLAYGYLRQLRPVTQVVLAKAAKTVVHALISSCLNYCNSLLFGISDNLFCRLHAVQNAAVRLVTGTRRREYITPVLWPLHCLPVLQHIVFKLAVSVYKVLNGLSLQYLVDDCNCMLTTTTGRR